MPATAGRCASGCRMTLTNTDGQDIQMVSDYATWESKDGLKFRFHMKQTTDTAVTSQTDGDALLDRPAARARRTTRSPRTPPSSCRPARCSRWRTPPRSSPRRGQGKQFLTPAAVRRHRRQRRRGQLRSSFWTGSRRSPTSYPFLAALPSTRVSLAFFDPFDKQRGADIPGRHALLGKRRRRQPADGFRRLRHGRQAEGTHPAATQVLIRREHTAPVPRQRSARAAGTDRSAPG